MPDTEMTEFDDLVAQLREERPRIDPAFARELDSRAAAGFPRKRRRAPFRLPRLSLMAPGLAVGGLAALVITVAVVGGGTPSSDDASSTGGGSSSVASAPEPEQSAKDAAAGVTSEEDGRLASPVPPPIGGEVAPGRDRVQERSASMTLLAPAKEVADVGDRVIGVADQVGGFVVSSSVRATDGASGGGDFQLRVPEARLDDALARLSRLGHVRDRQQNVMDITAERNSVRDQLQEATAERRSLLRRLGAATTDNEVASLRARLRDVNGTISGFRDGLARVNRRAQYAAVSVTLMAEPKDGAAAPGGEDGKWTPGDAARDALRVLEVAAAVLLLIAAVLAPLALLGGAWVAGRRYAGRKGRERMLDAV